MTNEVTYIFFFESILLLVIDTNTIDYRFKSKIPFRIKFLNCIIFKSTLKVTITSALKENIRYLIFFFLKKCNILNANYIVFLKPINTCRINMNFVYSYDNIKIHTY